MQTNVESESTPPLLDLSDASVKAGVLEGALTLHQETAQLRVQFPAGTPGRAEALVGAKNWAAKHFWNEVDSVVVYEWDEPLPAGVVRLKIPFQS